MAVIPIWIGSHLSLHHKGKESMSSEDAWKFPFIGSAVLFGLYLLFKMFSKEYINFLLTLYFLVIGLASVTATLSPLFAPLFPKKESPWKFSWMPPWTQKNNIELEFGRADMMACIVGVGISLWYVQSKHWIANNIFGLCFSIQGVAMLSLGSFKVGCVLLGGLFFYDIFWVFGTDVMVTVAKSFDAPIKLIFPKQLFAETLEFSMLGLGDIVIPGIFIALLLRFDVSQTNGRKTLFKYYFYTCYAAYFVGLLTTMVVMHVFKAAQPALLYLVPACIGSSVILAVARGEMKELLAYEEDPAKKEPKATDKKGVSNTSSSEKKN